MDDERIVEWKKAKRAREQAEEWNALPKGKKYMNDTFIISIPHCKAPKLNRMGQQYAGSQNYWETEEPFNNAILEYLVDNWDKHYPNILKILKDKEIKALNKCQGYIDEMQKIINEQTS